MTTWFEASVKPAKVLRAAIVGRVNEYFMMVMCLSLRLSFFSVRVGFAEMVWGSRGDQKLVEAIDVQGRGMRLMMMLMMWQFVIC